MPLDRGVVCQGLSLPLNHLRAGFNQMDVSCAEEIIREAGGSENIVHQCAMARAQFNKIESLRVS